MSMISEQIKRLRDLADDTEVDMYSCCELNAFFREAADTIEDLSAKLASANMERSTRYYDGDAFNKIKEQLIAGYDKESNSPVKKVRLCDAIEIVNQLQEEFATDTNVGDSSSEKPNKSENLTSSSDGWIPVSSGKLPIDREIHECTVQFSTGMRYIEYAYYDIAREEWWSHDDSGLVNVVAWKPTPEPYQLKGE